MLFGPDLRETTMSRNIRPWSTEPFQNGICSVRKDIFFSFFKAVSFLMNVSQNMKGSNNDTNEAVAFQSLSIRLTYYENLLSHSSGILTLVAYTTSNILRDKTLHKLT